MAVAAGNDWPLFGDARFLAEARERVIFPENGDDRTSLAGLSHDGGRNAGNVALDPEALGLEKPQMFG
jgi:hypothetical protein